MVEQGIANEQLEARIRELEDEKSKMMREHENALIDAVNQICGKRVKRSRKVQKEVKPEPCSP
jgi:transcription antitermination factor NusA-like protein